jgi:Protein of unknown function DUF262
MNINPDYQRDVVWSEARMVHLIDSLFNNYYVPPLIFKVISGPKPGTNERRRWRTCIDGKQRLTSIRRFFDGEIPYIDKKRQKWYYCEAPNSTSRSTRRLLPEDEKEFINNVQIVNIEYEYLADEQEEDMFQRVQLGVPLTVAEKLAALTGQLPSFVNDLRSAYPNIPRLVGAKRSNDFLLITRLLYLMNESIAEGEDVKLTTTQSKLERFLTEKDFHSILTPAFRAQARRVFSKFNDIIESNKDVFSHTFGSSKAKNRKFSPVEFLAVGVLIDTYPNRPARVLAEDVRALRKYLRERLLDLRSNSLTWIHVMKYISELEDSRGYFAPENESQANRRRVNNGVQPSPKRNPAFNPPTPDRQIHAQPTSIYNQRQQEVMQQRLAEQQQEQQEAFNRVPPARTAASISRRSGNISAARRPDYGGGVQERANNGTRKRTYLGVPVKREG